MSGMNPQGGGLPQGIDPQMLQALLSGGGGVPASTEPAGVGEQDDALLQLLMQILGGSAGDSQQAAPQADPRTGYVEGANMRTAQPNQLMSQLSALLGMGGTHH